MRCLKVSGIGRPMARAVLGTEGCRLSENDARARILDAHLAGGGNMLDTARTYGIGRPVGPHAHGKSEQLLGRWIRERDVRDQVVIVTKGAHRLPKGRGLARMATT